MRTTHKILVRGLEEKRPFNRLGCRWEANIKMDLKEKVCEDVDSIHLA
jgi:hypothetical protein